jgi:hypothetical protein|tara:strand:- start:665 stop:1006 length:342 start_codon:yes stop_codon:yes gene_type:complete
MKLEVKAVVLIEDGKHVGKITAVNYRDQPFKYTDLVIELKDGMTLKAGFPTIVSKESKLGQLLEKFGAKMEVGTTIDPEQFLVGKGVSFLTQSETTPRGTFAKVIPNSIKPVN